MLWRRHGKALAGSVAGLLVIAGIQVIGLRALATGATPSYPTISGPSSTSGDTNAAISLGNFTVADAVAGGTACGIGTFRAAMSTTLGTLTVSNAGGATVTGSGTSSATITGTLAQVDAALDAVTLTSASSGSATVTTTFRPADKFAAGSNDYVFSTSNGHYYRRDYNSANVTWDSARSHAASQTFCGADGYLATITSADENTNGLQLLGLYSDHVPYWVSGVRASDASDPAGTACSTASCVWYWDPGTNAPTGEQKATFSSFSYGSTSFVSPWFSSQPDNSGPALVISWGRVAEATDAYRWDDVPKNQTGVSYGLAEFGNNTTYAINSVSTTVEVAPIAWNVSDGDPSTAATTDLGFGTREAAYSQALDVSGGVLPFTFTVTSGSLPDGLSIAKTADRTVTVSGTPTAAGTFAFSITAADSSSGTTNPVQSFTVVITRLVMPDLVFAYPLATTTAIAGPSTIGGGSLMAMCLFSSDASGVSQNPTSLRFDTGTVGSAQSSISINGATVTLTNDYSYGDFLARGVSAANLQDQFDDTGKITISRTTGFLEDFRFTVRLVPYWSGTTPTCSTSNGGVVSQTVLVRSLGASFVDTGMVSLT